MHCRHRRKQFPASLGQLELPLGCLRSARAVPPQSLEWSNFRHGRHWQDRPATVLAMPAPLCTVQVTCDRDNENNRKRQRFSLTPTLSALINEVNGKRWPYVSALSPFLRGAFAKSGEGRAHVRGRGAGRLSAHSMVRYQRRTSLPALPVHGRLRLRDTAAL